MFLYKRQVRWPKSENDGKLIIVFYFRLYLCAVMLLVNIDDLMFDQLQLVFM